MIPIFSGHVVLFVLLFLGRADAHLAAWSKAMYCLNGAKDTEDLNSDAAVQPLYQRKFEDWWMHHTNKCDEYPPPPGVFLDLPAGGSFTVEIASNRAHTTLAWGGKSATRWPDGSNIDGEYQSTCGKVSPRNIHAENRSMVAGTAFAISYTSDIKAVTPENLAVFTVDSTSPWERLATFQVPAAMPACPKDGCICVWGWVPDGCGEPNMFLTPHRCRVTNAKSTTPVAAAKPPKWCEGNPGDCVKGAKQMVYRNQLTGNNIEVSGSGLKGRPKSPGYNMKLGFANGAQNDIFEGSSSTSPASSNVSPAEKPPGTKTSSSSSNSATPSAIKTDCNNVSARDVESDLVQKLNGMREGISFHHKRQHSRQF